MITSSPSVGEIYAEGQRYFMGEGKLNNALAQLVADLKEHQIDYLVIGAIALMAHGYPRFTEDIDLILTREGIDRFHAELVGLGYVPAFPGSRKRLKSTRDGSPIELIAAGEYPGDVEAIGPYRFLYVGPGAEMRLIYDGRDLRGRAHRRGIGRQARARGHLQACRGGCLADRHRIPR